MSNTQFWLEIPGDRGVGRSKPIQSFEIAGVGDRYVSAERMGGRCVLALGRITHAEELIED